MGRVTVLLAIPESPLTGQIAARLEACGISHHICSLDAPLRGNPLTVAPGAVIWEGVDLMQADVIFVEKSVFPWPQRELPPQRFHNNCNFKQGVIFQREAMSLIVSALRIAGEGRRMINRPGASHIAISPSIALDTLSRNGIPVHSWRLETSASGMDREAGITSSASGERPGSGFVVDASGADRWHSPKVPRAPEPVLVYEPFAEEVVTVLVVGGNCAGALLYRNGGLWAQQCRIDMGSELQMHNGMDTNHNVPRLLDSLQSMPEAKELAVRAAAALDVDIAAVSIRSGTDARSGAHAKTGAYARTGAAAGAHAPSVLLCEAAPDLAAWNRILKGRPAAAVADHLTAAACK